VKRAGRRNPGGNPPAPDVPAPQLSTDPVPAATESYAPAADGCPVVGIGASAGGLEALERFFAGVPPDSGLAFVVVQHLDPDRKAVMAELLRRSAPIPVTEVQDGERVEPNHAYVIPPNKDLSMLRHVLHLFEPVTAHARRLPIDFFFRALAEDQRERSIGVVLSGMGTDGTLGVRAIKEAQGMVLVQDPATAKFDGMPGSAIDSGIPDIVAPPDALCGRLLAWLETASRPRPPLALEDRTLSALEKIVIVLRQHTGNDFSQYKRSSLYRRIERRIGLHQLAGINDYVRLLRESGQERTLLFKELLIGVTSFFRDPAAWAVLSEKILPRLLATRPGGGELRAWVAGCSTGEEAYSVAIAFKEAVAAAATPEPLSMRIFATDLDRDAIDRARAGFYPPNIAADLSPEQLARAFVPENGRGYRVRKEVREMVTFAPQNLTSDPPFTRLDLLVCRNVLIYLTPELQGKLLRLFHYSLNRGGCLFLGSAETVGHHSDHFETLDAKWRLYHSKPARVQVDHPVNLPASLGASSARRIAEPDESRTVHNLQAVAEQLLLRSYAPAAVLVDAAGDILYVSGRTGRYLEPAAGRANWNLFAMARDGLRHDIMSAFRKLQKKGAPSAAKLAELRLATDAGFQLVDVVVQALKQPAALAGLFLVVFSEPVAVAASDKRRSSRRSRSENASLEAEVSRLRDELQSTREDMQGSHEELKSANEELQSTNEELQSTNEELTTAKEEMQSLNEELQTVNAELQAKVEELSRANNDMKNLLNSTDIATLFLDDGLKVRRFTTQASQLIKLIPSDIGRPVTDIASELIYAALAEDVASVLATLAFVERRVATADGRLYTARVMPYRTLDNRIDGVVVTFTEITAVQTLEDELREIKAAGPRRVGAPEKPGRRLPRPSGRRQTK
jgi:chemotaxis methyl-accepting protein methylase